MKSSVRCLLLFVTIALCGSARLLAQAPANDAFANATTLSGTATSVTGNNASATAQTGEPSHAGSGPSRSVWWAWTAPSNGTLTLTTAGSNFDTVLAVYTGTAVGSLTGIASNDDSTDLTSALSFTAVSGTTYRIAVDGYAGATGSIRLNLNFTAASTPPPPTTAPANNAFANATTISGTSATVTGSNAGATRETGEPVHADAGGGLSVWWAWTAPANGTVTLATAGSNFDTVLAVYTGSSVGGLTRIASDDDGGGDLTSALSFPAVSGTTYRIAVDGYGGASGAIRLSLSFTAASTPPPPPPTTAPANNAFASATTITGTSATVTGSNAGATRETGEPVHADSGGGLSVWWTWTAPANGTLNLSTAGSSFDTVLAVYTGSAVGSLTRIASDDDSGGNLTSAVSFAAVSGTTYRIAVDGYAGASGSIRLALSFTAASTPPPPPPTTAPANNAFASATTISGSSATVTGTNAGATRETGEPVHADAGGGLSVWWAWTAPANGTATVTTIGSNFDTVLGIYTGSAVGSLTRIASDDDGGGNLTSAASFTAVSGTTYRIAVDGYAGSTGSIRLNLSFSASTPTPPPTTINPPANNAFASATTLSGTSASVTGTNVAATRETGEPVHADAGGGLSVWWTWTAPQSGTATITTVGSNFDTVLAVYTGSAVGSLTRIAADDDSGGNLTSGVSFNATSGTTYRIAVDGYGGANGSIRLNLSLIPSAPTTPTPPPTSAAPSNNAFASAATLSGSTATVTGTNVGATRETGEPVHADLGGGLSVWWTWTAPASGTATITTAGSNFDTVLAVYTGGAVGSLTRIAANDDGGTDLTSAVSFSAVSGTTYRIAVDGYGGDAGSIRLNLNLGGATPPPTTTGPGNNAFASASSLTGTSTSATGTNSGATRETGEPTHADVGGGVSVWWTWTAPSNGSVTITTAGSNFDTVLAVYTGGAVDNLTRIAANDDSTQDLTSAVTFGAVGGTTYRIAVDGYGGSIGSIRLNLSFAGGGSAPTIVSQPVSQSVNLGATVTFSVAATGTAPLSYQWRVNGANISGATTATLSLSNVSAALAGTFSVVVSNPVGSVTSSGAALTIGTAPALPAITRQPVSQTLPVGGTATFSVTASSSSNLTYQWRFNGNNIAGATSATLNVTNLVGGNAGAYSVVVTNATGSVASSSATLTVSTTVAPPMITAQPQSQSALAGGTAIFAVQTSSAVPASYQWRINGTDIGAATSPTLTISNVASGNGGVYSVVVSNAGGSVTSSGAALTVVTQAARPVVVSSPVSQAVIDGSGVTLSVTATGSGMTYQWLSSGVPIPGATGPTYSIPNVTDANAGFYAVRITNSAGSVVSNYAIVTPSTSNTRITNVSTRGQVPGGGNLTPGIVLRGTGTKRLLIRAIGPTLGSFGLPGTLPDPQFQILLSGVLRPLGLNNDWDRGNNIGDLNNTMAGVGAFALSGGARDAALATQLEAGNYTVQITGKNAGESGIVLGEIYDVDPLTSPVRIMNVSTTALAGAGDQVLTAGFAIRGSGSKQLLIRAAGPSLAQLGAGGTVSDPMVTLIAQAGDITIASNDDWGRTPALEAAFTQVGAFRFSSELDAAMVVRIPPGVYTVQVRGVNNATGLATVEIYDLDP